MFTDFNDPAIDQPIAPPPANQADQRPRRPRQVMHSPDHSSDEEEIAPALDVDGADPEDPADYQQQVRDRIAANEVPLDVLQRQRGNAPIGAYALTEQEAQREIANSILFCFMDVLSIGAWLVCLFQDHEPCHKPLVAWYTINGMWACVSLAYLAYYSCTQLKHNFQTKRSIAITYGIEGGYLILSIWAWIILAQKDPDNQCQENASGILELLVDMIILLYMRSLRLLSIVLFVIICGPLLLACWYKNRPVPAENPADLIKQLCRVKVSEFKQLRLMNYRHAPTPRNQSVVSGLSSGDLNSSFQAGNPYEGENLMAAALESCCICMEDFETNVPESTRVVDNELGVSEAIENIIVVLPCKSHFFHEECIAQWIQKQNGCPICREEITLARLKEQKKEVKSLLAQAKKMKPLSSPASVNTSIVSSESESLLNANDKYGIQ